MKYNVDNWLEFKSKIVKLEDGIITEDEVAKNRRLSTIAKNIFDNYYDTCRNVFVLFPEKIFYAPSFYKSMDELYLDYYYSDSYSMKPYYGVGEKRITRYIYDFHNTIAKFQMLLIEDFNVAADDSMAVAWKIIKKISHKYFTEKWENKYEQLCKKNLSDCTSIEELMDVFCESDIINPYDIDNIALFTHLTIQCNGTNGECSKGFLYAFDTLYELIIKHKNEKELDLFRKKIQTSEKKDDEQVSTYSIDDIDIMNGNEFEHFICDLFSKMGYYSEVTKQTGDQGLDVIAEKNGKRIGVQAKCYSNTVGNSAIQEAVAGKNFYNCDKVIVVTNNSFTSSAIELAQVNDVVLWDRSILKEKISEIF